jgi:protease-4
MTVAQVDSAGQGRVWTGTDAKELGLVDELGGLEDAIQYAAELAGMSDYRTVELPVQKEFYQQLLEDLNAQASVWATRQWLGGDAELLRRFEQVKQAKGRSGILARMPYDLEVR